MHSEGLFGAAIKLTSEEEERPVLHWMEKGRVWAEEGKGCAEGLSNLNNELQVRRHWGRIEK